MPIVSSFSSFSRARHSSRHRFVLGFVAFALGAFAVLPEPRLAGKTVERTDSLGLPRKGGALPYALAVSMQGGATATPVTPAVTTLDCSSVSSDILGRSVNVCVALPAGYESSPATRYPVLYFLHGLFENERRWSERGGKQVLDDLLSKGEVGKFLVVLPDGGKTFYVNSFDGRDRYEDFFIQELVPAIDKKYRTTPARELRGISGTSMGGYGALHLAMRHSDVFGSVGAHSAVLLPKFPSPIPAERRWQNYARILEGPFGSPLNENYWEENSPLTLAEHPGHFAGLKLYFDCGDHDRYGFNEGAQLLDQTLTAKGFPHEFTLRPGEHGWSYLNQYLKYSLLFHWRNFQQGQQGPTVLGKLRDSPPPAPPSKPKSEAAPSADAEARLIEYLRDHLRPGEPLRVVELRAAFTQPDEQKALDKLYNAFFRIPLFVAQYQQRFGSPPSLKIVSEQFDLRVPGAADVLLRVMESDPRVPRFLTRDEKTGEIARVDVEKIRGDARFGQELTHRLAGWEDKPAPPLALATLTGSHLDLEALRGKVVLLEVWFTGCPPCMQETPLLVSLDRKYSGQGLVIVGANADRVLGLPYDDVVRREYVEKSKIQYPIASWTREADKAWGNISIFPTLFLINRKGIITRHWIGYVNQQDLERAVALEVAP